VCAILRESAPKLPIAGYARALMLMGRGGFTETLLIEGTKPKSRTMSEIEMLRQLTFRQSCRWVSTISSHASYHRSNVGDQAWRPESGIHGFRLRVVPDPEHSSGHAVECESVYIGNPAFPLRLLHVEDRRMYPPVIADGDFATTACKSARCCRPCLKTGRHCWSRRSNRADRPLRRFPAQ
jgi:hypothetical protein